MLYPADLNKQTSHGFYQFVLKNNTKNQYIQRWTDFSEFCYQTIILWSLNQMQSFSLYYILVDKLIILILIMFRAILSTRLLPTFSTEIPKVSLPELKYSYSALQPVISSKLLQTHHKKHHQTYVNNLNAALDQFQEAKSNFDYNKMAGLCQTIKFNLGGHINHSIYWENLAPIGQGGGQYPPEDSPFTQQVVKQFGSYDHLIQEFTKKTVPIQGSGWGWLGYDNAGHALRIAELPNQEMLAPAGIIPLLTIDVWEHAYYIDYKNVRLDYVKQIWKIVNWKDAERRYLAATKK